jgi:2-polyprenyl-3-methyl-5-hydroxy-6-metoxy-1,4-benzoquinol methylase
MRDDPDRSWEWYGKNDPYFGVVSHGQFRRENLTEDHVEAFFQLGEAHVERVMSAIRDHFGEVRTESCLDFGCGVGRLVVPFARRFSRVVGVDISPSMIAEAKRNCEKRGVANASFCKTPAEALGGYDLVHSYIVIQHIPVKRGKAIIDELIDKVGPGGIAFLHFTIGYGQGRFRDWLRFGRRNFIPLHWAVNLLRRRKLTEALQQINEYNLNELMIHLHKRGIHQIWMESENHDGSYNVCLVFRVKTTTMLEARGG